ncbi:hypothetical protein [Cohnella sp. AR92]|uniref:hypothetical protein n=1 Tax=Cohnella sp. AR92 TaxID=648716 RepID=UPI000F8DA5AA|nr:hypothetical protein [Cohnella sp. AR92]RUS47547.1 hypothetical protein ELR57_07045 [Cohnella sp. AR92]
MARKYTCPYCKEKHYPNAWNARTLKTYKREIFFIQEEEDYSSFICPSCDNESELVKGELIEEATNHE